MSARFLWGAHYGDYGRKCEILAYKRDSNGAVRSVAMPMAFTFVETDQPDGIHEATMTLNYAEAQGLIDALLAAGIKPSKSSDESHQVAAIKYHLEDMRALAFKGEKP